MLVPRVSAVSHPRSPHLMCVFFTLRGCLFTGSIVVLVYLVAFCCVVGLSVGQILFKVSSAAMVSSGSFFSPKALLPLFIAMCLYGVITLVWVWVLQRVELGRVYPLMALAFVLVPLGTHFIFNERFHTQYFVGVGVIIVGIVIAIRS
ncbi:drug/metabolite transporter (DMT)-like permease [Herbaspirillum sp. Sphag1AN]|uniref:4-amino-4-deoxy-L-arabinose-phospho-UDP flippase n=1 Tax=unclassified Herbaspirillum TaxID=2624150 RepID=UPI0018241B4C|nr:MULTISPECIES: 4-amino-4-deoxy-L-arabinose-phospho-UDP flippase [unclassified Herbaspirillum]MBB3213019.1 drug/metabolite transporter (DMT)-like permease [Herbaspirillum sp. Sphag1AN]MBB3246216.1 drug/metabolite transporter (DMT)-like permease [Herbaspirillum sp. Sphag64]